MGTGTKSTSTRTRDMLDEKIRELERLKRDSMTTTRTRETELKNFHEN